MITPTRSSTSELTKKAPPIQRMGGALAYQKISVKTDLPGGWRGSSGGGSPPRVGSNALNTLYSKGFSERSEDFSAAMRRESNAIFGCRRSPWTFPTALKRRPSAGWAALFSCARGGGRKKTGSKRSGARAFFPLTGGKTHGKISRLYDGSGDSAIFIITIRIAYFHGLRKGGGADFYQLRRVYRESGAADPE